MPLFERRRFVWNEPWFFVQRIRPANAWAKVSLFLSAISAVTAIILIAATPAGQAVEWDQVLALSLGLPFAIWWVLDGTNTRRQAVLLKDSIVVGGDMGKYSHPTTYAISKIPSAIILMPELTRWPCPALYFEYEGEETAIGIDRAVGITRLAQALHDAGIDIQYPGWQPNQESEFARTFRWEVSSDQVSPTAVRTQLPEGTNRIYTIPGILVALVRQTWAIALWLAMTGYLIYWGYTNWNNLGVVGFFLLFALPIGGMMVAGQITDRYASASMSKGLVQLVRSQFRKRPGIEVDVDREPLIPVEIFVRDQFDKTIQRIHEMGFIQPDPARGRLLFEGKKERWSLPVESLQSCVIEEVQVGTPGQSAIGALMFYIVIQFHTAAGVEEFGLREADRDYGDFNDMKRAAAAVATWEAIRELLPEPAAIPVGAS